MTDLFGSLKFNTWTSKKNGTSFQNQTPAFPPVLSRLPSQSTWMVCSEGWWPPCWAQRMCGWGCPRSAASGCASHWIRSDRAVKPGPLIGRTMEGWPTTRRTRAFNYYDRDTKPDEVEDEMNFWKLWFLFFHLDRVCVRAWVVQEPDVEISAFFPV